MRGTWRERSFTGDPERYVKETCRERRKNAQLARISLHRGPVGEPGGDSLAATF